MDIVVTFPSAGHIHFHSKYLFSNPQQEICQEFVRRVMRSESVLGITIRSDGPSRGARRRRFVPLADVMYSTGGHSASEAIA